MTDYLWSGNDRLVVSLAEDFGGGEAPIPTGELVAFNADGSNQEYLFGFRGGVPSGTAALGSRIGKGRAVNAFGLPIRSLPNDPAHILILARTFLADVDDGRTTAYRLDVRDGKFDQGVSAPVSGPVSFVADDTGFVRYAVGSNDTIRLRAYARSPAQPDWKELPVPAGTNARPLFLSRDSQRVFLSSDEGGEYDCLVEQNLVDGTRKRLACDEGSDLIDVIPSFDGNEPVAARFQDGRQDLRLLDTDNPSRAKLAELLKAFPGQHVRIVSSTRDGSKAIVLVDGDRNPGDYYLFQTGSLKADYLVGRSAWLDPDTMPARQPIAFKARDGQRIRGYLTVPPGRDARRLPLIVHPHGGPLLAEDNWDFDAESAALASRGYAVLQVNFRGSGGYGRSFVEAGKRGWATTMIDDIVDGARWAIEQGHADPERVGIYGASYGGDAALMCGVREPALFRSVASFAGVTDLPRWKADSDAADTRRGRNYLDEFIGVTDDGLRAASPLSQIDKLRAPVFIAHGEDDRRVPLSQAKELRKALKKADHEHEWLTFDGEGHGLYKPENRALLLTRVIAFFDRTLPPAGAAAEKPAAP